MQIGIIGSGSWATALCKILTDNGHTPNWYVYEKVILDSLLLKGVNTKYLNNIQFSASQINPSGHLNSVISSSDLLLLVTPSAFLFDLFQKVEVDLSHKIIFSAVKGIIPDSGLIVGEHLQKHQHILLENIGVITGPCHAEEVALGKLSYLTVASKTEAHAITMAGMLQNNYIKTTLSDDIIGTEYAAVLKNIYAIAAGIANGLGYGDNFQAVLMSNAIREMKRFIDGVYKMDRNINNSAYLGDLLVTGYSEFSRNRRMGFLLGQGQSVVQILSEMTMVAEGYYAVKSAYKMVKDSLANYPIIEAVYKVTYQKESVQSVFETLTTRLD